jgi:hypothetical protein
VRTAQARAAGLAVDRAGTTGAVVSRRLGAVVVAVVLGGCVRESAEASPSPPSPAIVESTAEQQSPAAVAQPCPAELAEILGVVEGSSSPKKAGGSAHRRMLSSIRSHRCCKSMRSMTSRSPVTSLPVPTCTFARSPVSAVPRPCATI